MSNKKRRCANCKKYGLVEEMIKPNNLNAFCDYTCAAEYGQKKASEKRAKDDRKKTNMRKKELMTRKEWYDKLQKLVNQFARIRDKDKPCCTCGTTKDIKYDAGHFIAVKRGGVDPRRFELTNIHKQCSINCNVHGSGMRKEYREFIIKEYGENHLEWLECEQNHIPLKLRFPHWTDIEKEIKEYRIKIRKLGYKPNA